MIYIGVLEIVLIFMLFSFLFLEEFKLGIVVKITLIFSIVTYTVFIINNYIFHNYVLLNYIMIITTAIMLASTLKKRRVSILVVFSLAYILINIFMYLVVGILNMCYLMGLDLFSINLNGISIERFMVIVISVLVMFLFKVLKLKIVEFLENHMSIAMLIVNVLLIMIGFEGVLQAQIGKSIWFEVIVTGILVIALNSYLSVNIYKIINENNKKLLAMSYNPLLDELIHSFRASEHEYKNHLATLQAMSQLNKNDESIEIYIGEISKGQENNINKIISIKNNVMKAVLFSKIRECEKYNIEVDLKVKNCCEELRLDDASLVVIISNLFNNAIEELKSKDEKKIIFEISNEKIYIANLVKGLKLSDLSKLMIKGYTLKGKDDRGYGLYNVKKIVDKNKSEINIFLDNGYLHIEISF